MNRRVFVALLGLILFIGCCSGVQDKAEADPDMSSLTKDASNPFPARTQWWELGENHDPEIIKVGTTYYMFYAGAASPGTAPLKIGVQSTSMASYPYGWAKYDNNPVLVHNEQVFDATLVSSPHPIQMQDGSFRLYFHGYNSGTGLNLPGFATTTAGAFPSGWTKSTSNPLFTVGAPGTWDDVDLRPVEVIIPAWDSPDNTWHLLYGGYDGTNWRGGHATSDNGVTWTKDAANPVLNIGSGWESHDVLPTGWFKAGSTYYILYQASNNAKWEIGYATTTNFVTFTKYAGTPIVTVGAAGQWDKTAVENPGAVYFSGTDTVDLWYVGTDEAFITNGSSNYRIGLARTRSFITLFGGTISGGTIR